jgi:hypothetical protein
MPNHKTEAIMYIEVVTPHKTYYYCIDEDIINRLRIKDTADSKLIIKRIIYNLIQAYLPELRELSSYNEKLRLKLSKTSHPKDYTDYTEKNYKKLSEYIPEELFKPDKYAPQSVNFYDFNGRKQDHLRRFVNSLHKEIKEIIREHNREHNKEQSSEQRKRNQFGC